MPALQNGGSLREPGADPAGGAIRFLRVLLAASVLVPALLFAAAAWLDRRVLMLEAERRVDRTAAVLEQQASAAFQAYEAVLARIAEHVRLRSDETPLALHEYLAAIDRESRAIGSLFVVDQYGRVLAHSRFFPAPSADVSDRDYFQALRPVDPQPLPVLRGQAGAIAPDASAAAAASPIMGLVVGAPASGRFSGRRQLNVARRVDDASGRFAAGVAVSVSQAYFEDFHKTLSVSPGDVVSLVRDDGTILARSPELSDEQMRSVEPTAFRDAFAAAGRSVRASVSAIDGVERLVTYRRLVNQPIWIAYALNKGAVLQEWRANLALYGLVAVPSALLLVGATWLALRRAQAEQRALLRLRAESAQRLEAEHRLLQVQKMDAIGQLTGGVAHDFNNLLAVVLGNLELLAKRLPQDDARLRRYVQAATEGAKRGAALTQRMLAFARRQDLRPETVDLPDLVRGMADLLSRTLGTQIAIETRFPARLPRVHVDANQLELALLNLAVNARDAMPPAGSGGGGMLVISAREARAGADTLPGLNPGRYVVLEVADTGEGMDEATLARAVEPFFTTKGVGKGTGLGLAMVHGLAAQSGGALALSSRQGEGTRVALWLPLSAEPAEGTDLPLRSAAASAAPATTTEPQRRPESRSLAVLVVDDDVLVLTGTAAMLEDMGHCPIEALSGRRALDHLAAGVPVDLVITDYAMPGMTGLDVAGEVARLRPGLPVLLATGFAELPPDVAAPLPRLAKPFTAADLARAVERTAGKAKDPRARLDKVVSLKRRSS